MSGDVSQGEMRSMGRAPAPAREKTQETCSDQEPDAGNLRVWALEPHICRLCFSRLVSCEGQAPGTRLFQCTNCGAEQSGAHADALCCCGMKIRRPTKGHKSGHHLVDAGVRCVANPDPSPAFPSLYVASEI